MILLIGLKSSWNNKIKSFHKVTDLTKNETSNEEIYLDILSFFAKSIINNNEIIIIIKLVDPKNRLFYLDGYKPINVPSNNDDGLTDFLNNYSLLNEYSLKLNSIINIINIQNFLKSRNIKFIFIGDKIDFSILSNEIDKNFIEDNLYNIIKEIKVLNDSIG